MATIYLIWDVFFFKGCFCPEGTLEKGNECVKAEECDASEDKSEEKTGEEISDGSEEKTGKEKTPTTKTCPPGKIRLECGNPCPPTCDNPQPFCFLACTEPGELLVKTPDALLFT